MHIQAMLTADHVTVLDAPNKSTLLRALSAQAAAALAVEHTTVVDALVKREALGSTGVGDGIALPHARLSELRSATGFFARLNRSVEFGAIDDVPVDLVFLLLLSATVSDEHLTPLACVARRLRTPGLPARLRRASQPAEIYALLVEV